MTLISNEKQEIGDISIIHQVSQSHPWLVMSDGMECVFFSISKDHYYKSAILPQMANKRIYSNCMEWLVLVDYTSAECSLLNINSLEKIELPKYERVHTCFCCNLIYTPDDPKCRLVFIDWDSDEICIWQPGNDKFIKGMVKYQEEDGWCSSAATCFDGSIYVIMFPTPSLIRADLNDPLFEFRTVVNGESVLRELLDHSTRSYLVESCGELLMVNISTLHEESFEFQVFRADFSTSKWVLLNSIDDRVIFLNSASSQGVSCSSSESKIQRNCIYYAQENNRTLYVFNMDDHSYEVTFPCTTISAIYLTPNWVMIPPTHMSYEL